MSEPAQPGRLITVEGIDGAGKSTHLSRIESQLRDAGIDVLTTREPGGTNLGERIRDALLHARDVAISPRAEALAMFAARAQHLDEVIEPALAGGRWVLCDRFTDATYAYQGSGRELGFDAISELERWTQGDRRPDLTLIFDVSGEIAAARMRNADRAPDRFERESDGFRERVRQGYAELAARYPERVRVVDASGSLEEVATVVHDHVARFLSGLTS